MKKQEAILISAYTGYLLTKKFQDVHKFIEETLGRPVQTIEMANEEFMLQLRQKLFPQIIEMVKNEVTENEMQ